MSWANCRNILCIRADNMGDVLMSAPAIRSLKQSFHCRITLLSSSRGSEAGVLIPEIDEVIEADLPWVKLNAPADSVATLAAELNARGFDGCVIFTVYSQSPLPAAMLAYMAQIPKRAAYCRENPYGLLSDWIPDEEPYSRILHQVERDLLLSETLGARTEHKEISIYIPSEAEKSLELKTKAIGLNLNQPFLIVHPGVSEEKRRFPAKGWTELLKLLSADLALPLVLTGGAAERAVLNKIRKESGVKAFIFEEDLSLAEFANLIAHAALVVSVNTGTVHLAAAVKTPVVVLYAQTNPQHTPWMVPSVVLQYSVAAHLQSRNQVIQHVNKELYREYLPVPEAGAIAEAVKGLFYDTGGKTLQTSLSTRA
ncbi:glycosyltransferase family 9 protein [Pedobacter deserti]|uniref:glycosyltransferase family 9 protein n=1 Tax=Pedobacter deserti TaxID=2817382 RepID=UPI00210CA7EB|nr:glycosyltransferase family 9 protein [Pedobacter sp. SYSU D00382]